MMLSDQLREAIENSGVSLYRVAKDSGVSWSVLHRFVNRERDMKLASAEKVAEVFGMRLTRPRRIKPKG